MAERMSLQEWEFEYMTKTTGYGFSDVGMRRENNEDCFLIDERLGLYVVCDGMGGHAAGEIASHEAAHALKQFLEDRQLDLETLRSNADLSGIQDLAAEGVRHASHVVHEKGKATGKRGMGTTMTLLLAAGNRAVIASVGDSRAYHCRKQQLELLTNDHTLANEMLIAGEFSEQQLRDSPFKHYLTRTVGTQEEVEVDTLVVHLVPDDVFLLCTDGLTQYFETVSELGEYMFREPARIPPELVAYANSRGGSDNVTALVVHVDERLSDPPSEKSKKGWQKWFTRVAVL
jgi:serine/threonine protein phosphatase PrpC